MAKQKSYSVRITEDYPSDGGGDGVIDKITREHFLYKNGNLVQLRSEYDYGSDGDGPDGDVDAVNTTWHVYDKRDRLIETRHYDDRDADGTADSQRTEKISYYKNTDTVLSRVSTSDENADGTPEEISYTKNTVNKKGQITKTLDSYDYSPADGVIDWQDLGTRKYNKKGDLIRETRDEGNNGTIDYKRVVEGGDKKKISTEMYDSDGDGAPNNIVKTYLCYKKGKLVEDRSEYDEDADGDIDVVNTIQYDRDKHGRIVEIRRYTDSDANGVPDDQTVEKFSYYKNTYTILSRVETFDGNADGTAGTISTMYNTVNKKGQIIQTLSSNPNEGDNWTGTFEYNKKGDVIRETRDHGNDGIINYEMVVEPYAYPLS